MSAPNDSIRSTGNATGTPAASTPAAGKPHDALPSDEDIGDDGIVQSDAGDDSILADLPGESTHSGPENGKPPSKTSGNSPSV